MFSGCKPLNTWGSLFSYITCELLVPHKLPKFSHENLFGSTNRFVYKIAMVFFFYYYFSNFLIPEIHLHLYPLLTFCLPNLDLVFLWFIPGKQTPSVLEMFSWANHAICHIRLWFLYQYLRFLPEIGTH